MTNVNETKQKTEKQSEQTRADADTHNYITDTAADAAFSSAFIERRSKV